MPRAFALTLATLAEHRSGALLCLSRSAMGRTFLFSRTPARSTRWGERYSRRGDPLGFGELPAKKKSATGASGGAVCSACEPPGSGNCAQCNGVGCTVCGNTGDCTVCGGAGALEAAPGKDPDSDVDSDNPDSSEPGEVSPFVALVTIEGLLQSQAGGFLCGGDGYEGRNGILARVAMALEARPVAMVLDVRSPGGDALGMGEASAELGRMRQGSGIPWCVYAREAASAAYGLATAGSSPGGLFVSQSSDVGCVGTWTRHFDFSKANEKEGVLVTYVESPEGKTAGNPDQPLSDEALARMQRDVDETTDRFVAAVQAYRPQVADPRKLRGDVRRGQVAVDEGLADATTSGLAEVCAVAFARGMFARAQQQLLTTTLPGAPLSAVPAPVRETSAMQYSAALLAAAGVAAGASDAAVEAALLPRLTLAAAVMAALGETDPVRARGTLGARLEQAGKADAVQLELAKKSVEADVAKRVALWEDAIRTRRIQLAQAFTREESTGSDGKPVVRRVYTAWATAQNAAYPELAAFDGWISSRVPEPGTVAAEPSTLLADLAVEKHGAAQLTERDRIEAKRAGVDPAQLAAQLSIQQRGAANPYANQERGA